MAVDADILSQRSDLLERSPFLRLLPPDARRRVSAMCTEQHFAFGQVIVREGDPSNAYFLLIEGRVRVVKSGQDGDEIVLHALREGDSFGEIGILNGGIRTATVRASTPVTVLQLDRNDFETLLAETPNLRAYLELQLQHRILYAFLKELTSFGDAPPDALHAILQSLRPVTFQKGDIILKQGESGGPMYFIEQGQIHIHRDAKGERKNLAFLRPGDYFGELSFFKKSRRHATARAHTECRLLALDPEPFAQLLERWPELRRIVDKRIASYSEKQEALLPLDFTEVAPGHADHAMPTLTMQRPGNDDTQAEPPDLPPAAAEKQKADKPPPSHRKGKLHFIPQIDETDCGAAALAMICAWFGRQVSIAHIRELSNTAISGTGLNDLCRAANELGLTAQAVKKAPSQIDSLPLPAILHWHNDHWLVLTDIRRGKARIADPAAGISTIPLETITENWSGYAAVFTYTEAFAQAPERRPLMRTLMPFVRPTLWNLLHICLITFLICGLQLTIPKLTQVAVDHVIPNHDIEALNLIVLGLGAALVGSLLLTILQRFILGHTATRLDGQLMSNVMQKLLSLPMRYFNNRRQTDIQRRLESVRAARYFLVHNSISGILATVQIISFLLLMTLFSPIMTGLFVGIMAPIYIGLLYFSGKVLRPAFHDLQTSEARFQQLQSEVIKGIEIVKASGTEKRFHQRTIDDFCQLLRDQSTSKFNIFCYEGTVQAVWFMSLILFIWIGVREIITGDLTIGAFIAFQMLLAMIYLPIQSLVNLWEDLQSSSGFITTLRDIIEATPEQGEDQEHLQPVPTLEGRIAVRNLSFTYGGPDAPKVLRDITFNAAPGQKIAIVGRSGSGKTTLVKCLSALVQPEAGTLHYDSVDATRLRHSDLRRHVGLVLQENYFFSGSIAANIAFGDDEIDIDRVYWAARIASAHDFIVQLPDGYDTMLGETSPILLSHGQRQTLAIARAIYRDPAILFLDEATNSLDIETERSIYEKLAELFSKRTVFLVTHRLNMISDADLILVLDRGRLIEQGRHHDLLNRRGLYYHLIRRQVE